MSACILRAEIVIDGGGVEVDTMVPRFAVVGDEKHDHA